MSLYDQLKEIDKEEKKLNKQENADVEAEKEKEPLESAEDDVDAEEDKQDEKGDAGDGSEAPEGDADRKAPEKNKEAGNEEEKPDAAAFAKLRRDAAEAKREAAEAKKREQQAADELGRLKNPQPAQQKPKVDLEPDAKTDPEAHLLWQVRQANEKAERADAYIKSLQQKEQLETRKNGALDEFTAHEERFMEKTPDYQDVTQFGLQKLMAQVRAEKPELQGKSLGEEVQRRVLFLAAMGQQLGFDPAEYLYLTSKNWGYQPKEQEKTEETEKKKPDFKKIVDHKKKSTSSLAAGGKGGKVPISKEAFSDKSFGFSDFARLSASELKELEAL